MRISDWSSDVCSSDLLVLNAATLGTLAAVPAFDARELAQVLTLNVSAQAALLGAFDPMLRASDSAGVIALTSSVARTPRAFWGMYGASKAAFENLVLAYGDEVENTSKRSEEHTSELQSLMRISY